MIETPSLIMLCPLLMQALLMMVDEFYFHRRRGLPKWEIIGHPLDTLTVIVPLIFTFCFSFTEERVVYFIAMAIFSCCFVVKDELIHKNICSQAEMILHALLFIFHPVVFMSFFSFWKNGERALLGFQLCAMCAFCLYQIFYWRFFYDPKNKQRHIQRAR